MISLIYPNLCDAIEALLCFNNKLESKRYWENETNSRKCKFSKLRYSEKGKKISSSLFLKIYIDVCMVWMDSKWIFCAFSIDFALTAFLKFKFKAYGRAFRRFLVYFGISMSFGPFLIEFYVHCKILKIFLCNLISKIGNFSHFLCRFWSNKHGRHQTFEMNM